MISSVPDKFLIKADSADLDEMPPYVASHVGFHCLPKHLFIGIQNEMVLKRPLKKKTKNCFF